MAYFGSKNSEHLKVEKLLKQLTGSNGSKPLVHKTSSYTTYLPTKQNGGSVLYFNQFVSPLDTRKVRVFFSWTLCIQSSNFIHRYLKALNLSCNIIHLVEVLIIYATQVPCGEIMDTHAQSIFSPVETICLKI